METSRIKIPKIIDVESSISKIIGGSGTIIINTIANRATANCRSGVFRSFPTVRRADRFSVNSAKIYPFP